MTPAAELRYERTYRDEYEDIREIVLLMYGGVRKPVDSVYWGARRISRLPKEVPARRAFVRLISGHARFGVTDSPLDPLDLPPQWKEELSSYRRRLEQRAATIHGFSDSRGRAHPFDQATLAVDPEISVSPTLYVTNDVDDHQPVGLGEGYLVRTPYDPRGHPRLPATIYHLLPLIDGRRTVRDILLDVADTQCRQADDEPALDEQIVRKELASLYWHGALEITRGPGNGVGLC